MAGDIDALVDRHGEGTVRKAFWLQEKIYEEGIEGVHFSEKAETEMKKIGSITVGKAVRDELGNRIG